MSKGRRADVIAWVKYPLRSTVFACPIPPTLTCLTLQVVYHLFDTSCFKLLCSQIRVNEIDVTQGHWGSALQESGSSEEDAWVLIVSILSTISDSLLLLSNYSYRTVIRNDARTQGTLDTNTMRVRKRRIPPLDVLIIPNAIPECKTIRYLFANFSDGFYLSHYIIVFQVFTSLTAKPCQSVLYLFLA